ncbi:MAG: DUF4105 domain-containing protein [Planctomycetota bacterium]
MKTASGIVRYLLIALARISVLLFFIWSAGAIYYLRYLPWVLRAALTICYVAGCLAIVYRGWRHRDSASAPSGLHLNRAVGIVAATIPVVYLLTLGIQATNDRQWAKDQSELVEMQLENDVVTIDNFRNAQYQSESVFDVFYETRSFKLSEVTEVWFIVQRFTAVEGLAHTFISFGIQPEDGSGKKYFSVSVEIRREEEETYSPWRGLFRNYELNYVVGDERDMIGVRTVHRPGDRVFLYKTNSTPEQAQQMLCNIIERTTELREQPEFYNTFLNNCTNSIVFHSHGVTPEPVNWMDPRVVFPGYSDRLAYEMELIGNRHEETLEALSERSRIDQRAREIGIVDDFSRLIRESAN